MEFGQIGMWDNRFGDTGWVTDGFGKPRGRYMLENTVQIWPVEICIHQQHAQIIEGHSHCKISSNRAGTTTRSNGCHKQRVERVMCGLCCDMTANLAERFRDHGAWGRKNSRFNIAGEDAIISFVRDE